MTIFFNRHKKVAFLCLVVAIVVAFFALLPDALSERYLYSQDNTASVSSTTLDSHTQIPSYVSTPDVVKGIYMTSWVASSRDLRGNLVKLIDETELNTVVIDIKDYTGKIIFPITSPALSAYGSEEVRVKDLPEFIESLHKKNIYVIGRIAVFQDAYFVKYRPDLAVKTKNGVSAWKDRKGISWIDVGAREYWDYIILLSKESHKIGFDEINFDYIRFPSDGNMKDISFPHSSSTPKTEVLKEFFQYLQNGLVDSGLKTSADLFGMTTTARDDMGIGQLLENTLPYFDYISPMVYPSHYPSTFDGFAEPEAHPYEVVKFAMQAAVNRAGDLASTTGKSIPEYKNKLRPWLQDFGLRMTYGPAEVRAQIKATNDTGLTSWMLWSASNKYTKGALDSN